MSGDAAHLKHLAGVRAAEQVHDGMRIGLGSGSTAEAFVRALAPRVAAGLRVTAVASSERTERLAHELGIPLVDLTETLDLAVDGADAIECGSLDAIKGLGGALTREKLVAVAARTFVLVADDTKLVGRLSEVVARVPIPVEVLRFGWQTTRMRLEEFGRPVPRERDGQLLVTDNGNHIIDLHVAVLESAGALGEQLRSITGVVEHGLFVGIASRAIVATPTGIVELTRETA